MPTWCSAVFTLKIDIQNHVFTIKKMGLDRAEMTKELDRNQDESFCRSETSRYFKKSQ